MGECEGVRGVWGYMRGGMGGLTQSLAKSCESLGVDIFTSTGISNISVKNGRATGVVSDIGDDYHSRIVVSGTDCNITFVNLIDSKDLPEEFLRDVKRINYDSASVKINLATDALPEFQAKPGTGEWLNGTIHICPDMQYIEDAYADSVAGRPSEKPILEMTIPSKLDQTLAPKGKYIINLFTQYGPYNLREGLDWETERENYANRAIDILCEYAPNMKNSIIHRQILTPVDLEREYFITGGSLFHGRMTLDQMFHMRPVPGYANYRTPIKDLYLCGSATHPGGGVMGTSGLNASKEILKDW